MLDLLIMGEHNLDLLIVCKHILDLLILCELILDLLIVGEQIRGFYYCGWTDTRFIECEWTMNIYMVYWLRTNSYFIKRSLEVTFTFPLSIFYFRCYIDLYWVYIELFIFPETFLSFQTHHTFTGRRHRL